MKQHVIRLKCTVWLYPGLNAAWHFVTIPKKESTFINQDYGSVKRGWGSLPVEATLGTTTWNTSIFSDKKSGTYMLPLKALVRKKEHIEAGDTIHLQIDVCP